MDLGIKGKWALVTGAGRGLGEGICHSLSQEGARIVATSRTATDLEQLLDSIGGSSVGHRVLPLDIATKDGPSQLVKYIRDQGIEPDIIVNNVGGNLGFTDPLGSVGEWQKVMRLNVEVAIEINRAFIPMMREKRWGRICHISSISALENQGPPAYCAAKAALNAYVRSLGRFVCADNVILTSIMPGAIFTKDGYWDTASHERPDHVKKYLNERMAIRRFGRVEEITEIVTFLCSEHSSFCAGSALLADGGQGKSFYPAEM
ncbi:SDR family oxidoreductase [Alphaproteobacteria bacterium]|nr:SDR family oxidoreductase [Alphaproteobacteria bacterium]MDC0102311.1 SDR family oxidoreductase [Alphaproteobacteria bacterium]